MPAAVPVENSFSGGIDMDINELALKKHKEWGGKIEIISRAEIESREDLAVAYTPGVAAASLAIRDQKERVYDYTRRGNIVAVITDGTAVLGLGDIGPEAAMPVMEGKCALFKRFADIDAFPICIDSKDPKVIIETVKNISKSFGGINLEDISAPRCFEIEQTLIRECDVPVFHDDQHGAAIIAAAGLLNAVKFTGKKMGELKIAVNGAGAAGISIARLLLTMNFGEIIMCDRFGILWDGNPDNNEPQQQMAEVTNKGKLKGTLADAVRDADIFVGASVPGTLTQDMIRTMAEAADYFRSGESGA